jgi:hypothetical protein
MIRSLRRSLSGCCAVLLVGAASAGAQRVAIDSIVTTDSLVAHELLMRDGSRVTGRIVAVSPDSIRLQRSSGTVSVSRADVKEVRQFSASRMRNGEYWPAHPNATTLLFSSTAYPLDRGDRFYWTAWFLLHGVAVGVTDRLTIGGGGTLIPGAGLHNQFFFFAPKLTLTGSEGPQAAVGAFAGVLPGFGDETHRSLGILYGVGSIGSREKNFTGGLGWGYGGRRISSKPVVMVGGLLRGARQVALISENWFVPDDDDGFDDEGYQGLMSLGLRFIGHKVSFDVAYAGRLRELSFAGVPWVGLAVKF